MSDNKTKSRIKNIARGVAIGTATVFAVQGMGFSEDGKDRKTNIFQVALCGGLALGLGTKRGAEFVSALEEYSHTIDKDNLDKYAEKETKAPKNVYDFSQIQDERRA